MTGLFRYSIVRFRPFAETGEFANVGIVLTEIGEGRSVFRLAPMRFSRIKNFFDDFAYRAYRQAIKYLRKDLERAVRQTPLLLDGSEESYYSEFYRVRESSVFFSEARVLKSKESIENLADQLYDRFIHRNFASSENLEATLTKNLRTTLRSHGITHLRNLRVEDDVVPIILPLAYRSDEIYGIKPLAFSQKTPLSVFDHGSSWKTRFEYLLNRKKLRPHNVLLALAPPENDDPSFAEAYRLVEDELRQLPFQKVVADRSSVATSRIVQFAGEMPIDHRLFTSH
ncbi:DUF3037 domain-containing protein [Qipengyuania sp.]|uniref:DUF3037 domain-containing protein n=1 Tax=Qipengyuania sp. TaxID=2004515 RepID=UPI0035C87C32